MIFLGRKLAIGCFCYRVWNVLVFSNRAEYVTTRGHNIVIISKLCIYFNIGVEGGGGQKHATSMIFFLPANKNTSNSYIYHKSAKYLKILVYWGVATLANLNWGYCHLLRNFWSSYGYLINSQSEKSCAYYMVKKLPPPPPHTHNPIYVCWLLKLEWISLST